MSTKNVNVEVVDGVSVIRLQRSPRNAITLGFAREIGEAFISTVNTGARSIVLTGVDDVFSAGLDLKEVPGYSREQQAEMLSTINRLIHELYNCSIPVVAAVNGHAIAGAFILVLTTDYRIGPKNDTAQFGLTEARAGIPFPASPAVVLQNEMSPSDIRFLTLYSRNISAADALAKGVFDELRPVGQVLARAIEVAQDLAGMPADSYTRIKRQFRHRALQEMKDIVANNTDPMMSGWVSEDAQNASTGVLNASPKTV